MFRRPWVGQFAAISEREIVFAGQRDVVLQHVIEHRAATTQAGQFLPQR
jgi:hypothetical protein